MAEYMGALETYAALINGTIPAIGKVEPQIAATLTMAKAVEDISHCIGFSMDGSQDDNSIGMLASAMNDGLTKLAAAIEERRH